MKKIIITIDKVGRPKVTAEGFTGGECLAKMKPILDALSDSKTVIEGKDLPEMYMQSEEIQQQTEGC